MHMQDSQRQIFIFNFRQMSIHHLSFSKLAPQGYWREEEEGLQPVHYRGTSLIKARSHLGPYSRPGPRALRQS